MYLFSPYNHKTIVLPKSFYNKYSKRMIRYNLRYYMKLYTKDNIKIYP